MNEMTEMSEIEKNREEGGDALSLAYEAWRARIEAWGEPRFRADQICNWIYGRKVFNYHEMSNLSKSLRERLSGSLLMPAMALRKGWARSWKSSGRKSFQNFQRFGKPS